MFNRFKRSASFLPTIRQDPLAKVNDLHKNETIFTRKTSMTMDFRTSRRNNNVFVVCKSSEDVRESFVKPNLLQGNTSYVIRDTTGALLKTMRAPLEKMGYEVRVLDLTLDGMKQSNHYNPFRYLHCDEDVLYLVEVLFGADYTCLFDRSELALFQALCFYLRSECGEKDRTLSGITKIFSHAKNESGQFDLPSALQVLDDLFGQLAEKDPDSLAVLSYQVFRENYPGTTGTGLIHSIMVRLLALKVPDVNTLTATDDIDLHSIGEKPVALFCIPNSDIPELNMLETLLYVQLFNTLYHQVQDVYGASTRYSLPHPVRFFLDEFESIGYFKDYPHKLATMRKYNISSVTIVRSISKLKTMYPDSYEVIIGNCDTHLFYGLDNITEGSAELRFVQYYSMRNSSYVRDIRDIHDRRRLNRFSKNCYHGTYQLTLEMLLTKGNDDCIVFIHGASAVWDKTYTLNDHPNYISLGGTM